MGVKCNNGSVGEGYKEQVMKYSCNYFIKNWFISVIRFKQLNKLGEEKSYV